LPSELCEKIIFSEDTASNKLRERLDSIALKEPQEILTPAQYQTALGILQGIQILKKPSRPKPSTNNSKAALLREVERQIHTMDREQQSLAIQIPPGPQRIRGLSGSGKTIVLCMKVTQMHLQNPEWTIVYTFYTRSLYKMIKTLITQFCKYYADIEPNWDKIIVMHGWGGKSEEGVYSTLSNKMGIPPKTWGDAVNAFTYKESNELLGKCCNELLKSGVSIPKIYDAVIIDEGQDFHFSFYKLCLASLKEPKRLIWAYDEVQSLEAISIPTTVDIFGVDSEGNPVVSLEGDYEEEIEKDVVLYRCYRTPRPVLVTAHVFGMGLLRPEGAVQIIPTPEGWEDIGYKVISGTFKQDNVIKIYRPKENSPHILEDLVSYSELIKCKDFETRDDEIDWVANQINKNIKIDELNPEEILVICLNNSLLRTYFNPLEMKLINLGVNCIRPGFNSPRGEFQQKGIVTLSHIYAAKGNEASVVYIIGFDYINSNEKIIVQLRNQAFTALTRTRGWVIVSGIGNSAKKLFKEIEQIKKNIEEITFKFPDLNKIQRNLDNLDYEQKRNARKEALEMAVTIRNLLAKADDPNLREEIIKKLRDTR